MRVINPVMRRLLTSGRGPQALLLLHYTGRKSGRIFDLPVGYHEIDGRTYVLEMPIRADLALVKAHVADRLGNVVYRKTARNFGPVMCTAATTVVVQVDRVV